MALVSSFMINGDIMKYVKREALSYENRLRLLLDAAEGLNYIHDLEFCHHDIKGANILIDKDGNARLADLGIASVAQSQSETLNIVLSTTNSSGVKGSYRWMPPEIIHPSHFPPPPNSMTRDIYAFGCTMLEVLTGRTPWYTERLDVTVMFKLFQQERPPRPSEGITDGVWDLIEWCWHHEPAQRPSSIDIVLHLYLVDSQHPFLSSDDTSHHSE
ncbi:kinase-like domain-containing protein [Flagelloscypha sp. PMI_526]|nr:kinase-like domain-containing protein [Flagelloscypha sp. PMI_526]